MGGRAISARPEEIWDVDEGAPWGIPFDLVIPSISERGRDYRVARLHVERCVIHQPPCRAWRAGNRRCRHLDRAVMVAEDPLRTLALDIVEAWEAGGWRPGAPRDEFGAAIYRSAQEAIQQMGRLDWWDDNEHRPTVTGADALAELGEKPRSYGPGVAGLLTPRVPTTPLTSGRVAAMEGVRIAEEALGKKVQP